MSGWTTDHDDTNDDTNRQTRRWFLRSAIMAGAAVAAGVVRPSMVAAATGYQVGDTFPGLEGYDVDGQPRSLADLGQRPILLQFCAMWCTPCRLANQEMPGIRDELDTIHGDGSFAYAEVLLENLSANPAATSDAQVWNQYFPGADLLLHPNGAGISPLSDAFTALGTGAFPTFVGIDRGGAIVDIQIGYVRGALVDMMTRTIESAAPAQQPWERFYSTPAAERTERANGRPPAGPLSRP